MPRHWLTLPILLLCVSVPHTPAAEPATPVPNQTATAVAYFEKHVRPLLIRRCYSCHSAQAKPLRGNLRLDTRTGWQTGGESGPAIRPGRPNDSLLIQSVRYDDDSLQMPPKKKLDPADIRILERWVAAGAADPRTDDPKTGRRGTRSHWAFRPIATPAVEPVDATGPMKWIRTPVDRYVLARLTAASLTPADSATRRVLLRRVCFDLTGLPPSPRQITAFLADTRPGAWERVIERLLASPHYGQKWGRHWLDVARYADSNGLDENIAHGNAWRYRDWVIDSLNADRPFDEFLRNQIAGDLVPAGNGESVTDQHARLVATGFLSLGPKVLAEVDERKMEYDIVDEQVDTVGRAFLGLTFGCARCHDHKFDPISTRDYYALAGIFQSTRTMEHFKKIARWFENPIATTADTQRMKRHEQLVADKKTEIDNLIETSRKLLSQQASSGQANSRDDQDIESQFPADTQTALKRLRSQLETLRKTTPELPTAMGVTDGTVANMAVHIRGSHLELGDVIPRQVPEVFARPGTKPFGSQHSGRLELANWMTSTDNPLTARVFVNRIWRWHFGRGLVASTDNFGQLGSQPTHPRLLDFLAHELVRGGWSIKRLHRLILGSATYRMNSTPRADAMARDPENRFLWRSPLRRLEAEALRDAMLCVAEELDTQMTGSLLHVKNRSFFFDHTSKDETRYDVSRRSVYLPVVRNHLYDVFTLFDYTDASVMTGDRATTTIAPQALFLLNSDLAERVSRKLAHSALDNSAKPADGNDLNTRRINRLYERLFGRLASITDVQHANRFLVQVRQTLPDDSRPVDAWAALCHVLLASNEFIYLK